MSAVSAAIIRCFSVPRFDGYLDAVAGDQEAAVALYLWNTEATGAMWETVGQLEVALRNVLADRLTDRLTERHARAGRMGSWLNDPARELAEKARTDIAKARSRVAAKNKSASDGQTVSELSFGFWRFFFARRYNTTLWPDLAGAFPHAPNRDRRTIEQPVERLHRFRNRLAHHERIWTEPLRARYADVLAVLGYIDPNVSVWVDQTSRYRRCSPRARLSARSRSRCDVGYDPARFDPVEINEALAQLGTGVLQRSVAIRVSGTRRSGCRRGRLATRRG